jgi:hypothetical protein
MPFIVNPYNRVSFKTRREIKVSIADVVAVVDKYWKYIQPHAVGIVIGAVVTFVILFWFFYGDIQDFHNLGKKVGSYDIAKGTNKEIATLELVIGFNDFVYRENYDQPDDSLFLYPSIAVNSNNYRSRDKWINNMAEGQVVSVKTNEYYYNIVLENIYTTDNDTIGKFSVYRNDLPNK